MPFPSLPGRRLFAQRLLLFCPPALPNEKVIPISPGPLLPCCSAEQVKGILEEYRIGKLKGGAAAAAIADPYAAEPERLPALIVRSQKPMNSGALRMLGWAGLC